MRYIIPVSIQDNVSAILSDLPPGVSLVAAVKSRTPEEIQEAVAAGVAIAGENFVQEAEAHRKGVGGGISWHFIGHLQKNKVKKAVNLFDMIQTVDSVELAAEIDRRAAVAGRVMPVLIEVNSGDEAAKSGVLPGECEALVRTIAQFKRLKVMGLMTMGPAGSDAEGLRPCFRETKRLFERIRALDIPSVEMKYLSMGMSDSYRVAVEEGANMVRIGTAIFGERQKA